MRAGSMIGVARRNSSAGRRMILWIRRASFRLVVRGMVEGVGQTGRGPGHKYDGILGGFLGTM